MTEPGSGSAKPWWRILALLLLAGGVQASTAQIGGLPEAAPRAAAANGRPEASVRKPAWKWTVEERLAKLFDPEERAARVRDRVAEQKALRALRPPSHDPLFDVDEEANPPADVIDGSKTPELFLPFELFTFLLDSGLPANGQVEWARRGPIEERAAALGFGQDLWPRLEKATAPFLELRREAERLHISYPDSLADFKKDSEAMRWCRTRARAIAAAKSEFGEEPFLRLLYEAVAPNTRAYFAPTQAPDLAEHLRYMEGGCQ